MTPPRVLEWLGVAAAGLIVAALAVEMFRGRRRVRVQLAIRRVDPATGESELVAVADTPSLVGDPPAVVRFSAAGVPYEATVQLFGTRRD